MVAQKIYFYKVDAPYGCFSNFSPHPIQLKGKRWKTVEHYYQAHKYVGTGNQNIINDIHFADTPEEAASLGRSGKFPLRPDWEAVKQDIMWQGVWTKFSTYADIQGVLLSTGDSLLIENSSRDYYWGCGKDGTGRNELGKTLMKVRQQLLVNIKS